MRNSDRPSYRSTVMQIQTFLTDISRSDPDIPRVNADGIYGKTTADAVYAFQKKYMNGGDGRVDFKTWEELLRFSRFFLEEQNDPDRISPFSQKLKNGYTVIGDRSELVMLIRIMLSSIALTYPFLENMEITDVFDSSLENSIKEFQIIQGLKPDGIIDKRTWNALATAYNRSLSIE